MAHRVFDVVAEDPEEEHVAGDVQPAAMQKHAGDQGEQIVPSEISRGIVPQLRMKSARCRSIERDWYRKTTTLIAMSA